MRLTLCVCLQQKILQHFTITELTPSSDVVGGCKICLSKGMEEGSSGAQSNNSKMWIRASLLKFLWCGCRKSCSKGPWGAKAGLKCSGGFANFALAPIARTSVIHCTLSLQIGKGEGDNDDNPPPTFHFIHDVDLNYILTVYFCKYSNIFLSNYPKTVINLNRAN